MMPHHVALLHQTCLTSSKLENGMNKQFDILGKKQKMLWPSEAEHT